jgi:ribosomal-protein-alanine N-acetyltransferase
MGTIPTLETERLVLRPFCQGDVAEVSRFAGDRSVAATTLNIPHPYDEGMACEWIAGHRPMFEKDEGVVFAITLKADGALVGAISLTDRVKCHQAELGYWIGKPYWGLGYCTEAAHEILRYAFGVLRLSRVHAGHYARNPASGRVMQKIGMRREGCRRHHVKKWGQLEDLEIYGVLEEEWRKAANKAMQRTRDKIGPDGNSEVASR